MPTTTFTPDEIAAANAEGAARGLRACPVCADSVIWKKFHETPHYAGDVAHTLPNGHTINVQGTLHAVVLCEECWAKMTPEERWPHYEAAVRKRIGQLGSVIRNRRPHRQVENPKFDKTTVESDDNRKFLLVEGEFEDDPKDAARYAREVAAIEASLIQVRDAVLAGK